MKEFNYYLKTHDNKPTAVVIVKLNNIIARGVAICNPKDHFNRKRGRMIERIAKNSKE